MLFFCVLFFNSDTRHYFETETGEVCSFYVGSGVVRHHGSLERPSKFPTRRGIHSFIHPFIHFCSLVEKAESCAGREGSVKDDLQCKLTHFLFTGSD